MGLHENGLFDVCDCDVSETAYHVLFVSKCIVVCYFYFYFILF